MKILALILIILITIGCNTANITKSEYGSLTIHNCVDDTWVGGVKWNADKSDYIDVPEAELKSRGWLDADLEIGNYAFTHYRPPIQSFLGFLPAAILEFRDDVKIEKNKNTLIEFGCE